MSSRTPPLLLPYFSLPKETALILFTSILGASTNWLVLGLIQNVLIGSTQPRDHGAVVGDTNLGDTKVILVSFLRDLAFWKENGRKMGLDLDKLAEKRRFGFVDGLGLFLPSTGVEKEGMLAAVFETIVETISKLQQQVDGHSETVLIIDQMDLLLAACGTKYSVVEFGDVLLDLRERVHATVLTLSADLPLVASQQTPLERNHAAFLISVSHQADLIMNLRMLDTGTAKDVSGVIRITVRDAIDAADEVSILENKEFLYLVGGDGGIQVFERGQ